MNLKFLRSAEVLSNVNVSFIVDKGLGHFEYALLCVFNDTG